VKHSFIYILPFLLLACNSAEQKTVFASYEGATSHTPKVTALPVVATGQTPKNVILMIGDGMGLSQMSAAWTANYGALNMLACPYTGLSRTYCANRLITDSGAGGTALAIGMKTNKGFVGCDTTGKAQPSLMVYAQEKGMRTAVSVVCRLCDATPADFCCHRDDRDDYDSINADYLDCNVDYIAGGGKKFFTQRKDGRNIIAEMGAKGYHVYEDAESLYQAAEFPVFACLADSEYVTAPERGDLFQRQTMKAIDMMGSEPFFMMVEASCIDDWCHANDLPHAIEETLDFDRTIGEVLQWAAKDGQTLVVITADHETAGLTLIGGDYKAGRVECHFANDSHSNIHVPVYAFGPGAENFTGAMENAEVSLKLRKLIQK